MKKVTIFMIIALLTLMVSSVAYGAPETVTGVSFTPTSGAAGSSIQMKIDFTATGGAYNALCIYAVDAGWKTNFPGPVTSLLGDSYAKDAVGTACPTVTGYTATKYDTATTHAFADGGDTLDITVVVPAITTGSKALVVRQYSDAGMATLVNTLTGTFTVTAAPTPNTGLSGTLIDSKTLSPWLYGAEIKIIQTTGTNTGLKGSTYVSAADGTWSITFGPAPTGTDALNLCAAAGGCTVGNEFATYQVFVNFTCDLETAIGSRTTIGDSSQFTANGECPIAGMTGVPVNFEVTVTDGATTGVVPVGDWETGRGPTAVNLQGFGTSGNNTAAAVSLAVLMFAGVTYVMIRRRRTA